MKCKGIMQDCETTKKLTHEEMVRRVKNFIDKVEEPELELSYPTSMLRPDLATGTVKTAKKRRRDPETKGINF